MPETFHLTEPCEPRPVRFLELLELGDWRMKAYGIAWGRDAPRAPLVEAARRVAAEVTSGLEHGHGVGYVGIHDGRGASVVFVDWWAAENELYRRVLIGPGDEPSVLRRAGDDDLDACIWDLAVIAFERDAWVEHVLRNPRGPDLEGYLAARLNRMV